MSREVTPEALHTYINDENNGLSHTSALNGKKITVTFKPTDLWVLQEVGGLNVKKQTLDSLKKKYSAYHYFVLSLSSDNKEALHQTEGGFNEYSSLLQTMSFHMSEYVSLTTKSDTIPVADFILNRTFGLSGSTDVLFVFSKEKTKGKDWVQFNLKEFGLNVGNQRYRFWTKDLEKAPRIKFDI